MKEIFLVNAKSDQEYNDENDDLQDTYYEDSDNELPKEQKSVQITQKLIDSFKLFK